MKKKKVVIREGIGRRIAVSPSLVIILEAVILTFILEILSRRSLADAFGYMIHKPHVFIFNTSIVSLTLAFAMVFRKKVFTVVFVTLLWLGFGIANCIMLCLRTASPLTSFDLRLIFRAIQMMGVYFAWWQTALIALAIIAAIALIVVLAVKSPKYRKEGQIAYLRVNAFAILFLVMLIGFTNMKEISANLRPSIYHSYMEYGFPYCFSYSFFDIGIREPKDYSDKEIESISDELDIEIEKEQEETVRKHAFTEKIIDSVRTDAFQTTPETYTVESVEAIRKALITQNEIDGIENNDYPNVIIVQLESFFDPTKIKGWTYTDDPIPNFRSLTKEFTSGGLDVPTVAGGTVNTEFEVLTGNSLDFFGAGELPYYSILRDQSVESLAIDLRVLDYEATAVHNYNGSFYYRDEVYQNMGFNRFVPLEYMEGYDLTITGWPKDEILLDVIRKTTQSTEGKDFVFAVTVQCHGPYIDMPKDESEETLPEEEAQEETEGMEYFLSMLSETDELIGNLVKEYAASDEKTIIVFYGDHLPSINLENEDLVTESIYETEYVIWSNYELPKNDRDLEAYQLGAYALDQIGVDTGIMIKFHQTQMDKKDYMRNLEILEYDMLYGERYIYGGREFIANEKMQMGVYPVEVTGMYVKNKNLFVEGKYFTSDSRVYLNDDGHDETIFINQGLLVVPNSVPEDGTMLTVKQISDEGYVLGSTEEHILTGLVPTGFRK